ncbi:MAG: hypothetical protein LBC18_09770 [Opitutaceae bacterium]|nr:hypothetical protein [Opitutaceae bacterium]
MTSQLLRQAVRAARAESAGRERELAARYEVEIERLIRRLEGGPLRRGRRARAGQPAFRAKPGRAGQEAA